jgi:hypothetical protein
MFQINNLLNSSSLGRNIRWKNGRSLMRHCARQANTWIGPDYNRVPGAFFSGKNGSEEVKSVVEERFSVAKDTKSVIKDTNSVTKDVFSWPKIPGLSPKR